MTPQLYTNNSGGAKGADLAWDKIGREFGVNNHIHWRPKDLSLLDPQFKDRMLVDVVKAAAALKRPSAFKGVELVQRNWLQVVNSQAIFAIGRIIEPMWRDPRGYLNTTGKQIIAGGTGWAVEMAIQRGLGVAVFDMNTNQWNFWDSSFNKFLPIDFSPTLTQKFAGIGSREITPEGLQAIRDVYKNTFKNN